MATLAPMPKTAGTDRNKQTPTASTQSRIRHVRIPDPLWNSAVEKAATEEGFGGAELIRHLLREYVRHG
jgi:hypothetical protein